MTGPSAPTGYAASANEEQANFEAYKAFNDTVSAIGTNLHHWTSPNLNYDNNGDFTPGAAAIHATNVGGTSKYGNWCQIELPHTFKYSYSRIRAPYHHIGRQPREGYIVGSNDLSGQWTILHKFSGVTRSTATDYSTYTPSSAPTQYFRYFRIVIEKLGSGAGSLAYAGIDEWELYGTPEYDPEAHGTDVTVKSYPNVPNTDFLDVFVDAGNASGFTLSGSDVTGVTDLSTPANTMTVNGNVTYNSANKAFVFPGTTSSYMRATLVNGNGNYPLTLSVWFMMTDYSGSWRNIITVGTNGVGEQASIAYDPDQVQLYFGTYSADIYVPHTPELGKWYHVAATFTGGSTTSSTMNVYLNGVNIGGAPNGTQTPSFTNNQFVIGGAMNSNGTTVNNPFKGQIGNTRFYRRAYSPDEIYQLYAYQKEDFGHSTNNMTLKAGRLGIGTSEPKAALDVRGPVIFTGRPNFTESLFFYTGNTPTNNYYASTYKNRHEFYLNTLIPPNSHIGNYGTGGDNQVFTESSYGGSNELCGSHFDCMVYWLKNAPVGHVHRLNWCSNNGSGGSQTYGQKTSGTQIRLWGYWFHTGTYDKDWTNGAVFNISTSTVSVLYEGATFQ